MLLKQLCLLSAKPINDREKLIEIDWLDQDCDSSFLLRLSLQSRISGHENDGQARARSPQLSRHLDPSLAQHKNVDQKQTRRPFLRELLRLGHAHGRVDLIAFELQKAPDAGHAIGVVIHRQNVIAHRPIPGSAGKSFHVPDHFPRRVCHH